MVGALLSVSEINALAF